MIARSEQVLRDAAAALGSGATAIPCDVTRPDAVDAAVSRIRDDLGGAPAVLVNNAGAFTIEPVESVDVSAFRQALDTNLVAPLRLTRAFLGEMRARGSGHIVTIGSDRRSGDLSRERRVRGEQAWRSRAARGASSRDARYRRSRHAHIARSGRYSAVGPDRSRSPRGIHAARADASRGGRRRCCPLRDNAAARRERRRAEVVPELKAADADLAASLTLAPIATEPAATQRRPAPRPSHRRLAPARSCRRGPTRSPAQRAGRDCGAAPPPTRATTLMRRRHRGPTPRSDPVANGRRSSTTRDDTD